MSKPQFTITLGRTGQVVKRSRSKRFVGSDAFWSADKRQRVYHFKWRASNNRFNDSRIARNDLRLKLMRKRHIEEQRSRNLHEKLSKPVQAPPNANMLWDGSRIMSPDRVWTASKELSIPDSFNEPRMRGGDVSRAGRFLIKKFNASRQTALKPVEATAETVKLFEPTGGIMQKNPHMDLESHTVPSLLYSLGLGKYETNFRVEEIDMPALKQMGDKDLKELKIPMGPRKKILHALRPHSKQQAP